MPVETERDLDFFSGDLSRSLKLIEEAFGVVISSRGNKIFIEGNHSDIETTKSFIQDVYSFHKEGYHLSYEDIVYALNSYKKDGKIALKNIFNYYIPVASKKRFVIPRTEVQRKYIDTIRDFDIAIGIGPAGTGKTYIAMAMAINAYIKKEVDRIILARPAIEAGERLGFLPGDMYEKVNPYLRPLYDALFEMMNPDKASVLIEKGTIEIAPLAFMRGRTLNDAFIILDEAQNTTTEQMKMYLTRLGFNSKTVITGDITQVDLPQDKPSGLIIIEQILRDIEGIRFVYFSEKDVVRHKLVQEIIKAYEKFEKR